MHVQRQRASVAGLLAALVCALSTGTAGAGSYPPVGVDVVAGTASPQAVRSGASVTFAGQGFAPGAVVRLSVDGQPAGTQTADALGAFTSLLTLGGSGTEALAASGPEAFGRLRIATAQVTVSPVAGPLPHTGSDHTLPSLLLGLGLVTVGAAVTLAARSRGHRGGFRARPAG